MCEPWLRQRRSAKRSESDEANVRRTYPQLSLMRGRILTKGALLDLLSLPVNVDHPLPGAEGRGVLTGDHAHESGFFKKVRYFGGVLDVSSRSTQPPAE